MGGSVGRTFAEEGGKMIVRFNHWLCHVALSHYNTPPNPIAIILESAIKQRMPGDEFPVHVGERIAVATVYLEDCPLAPDEVAIKSWSENKGMATTLEAAGVIGPVLRWVATGHVQASIHKLLLK